MNIAAAISTREKCSLDHQHAKEFHNIKYTNKISDQILKNIIHFNPNSSPNDQPKPQSDNETIPSMINKLHTLVNKTTLSILRSDPVDLDPLFQVNLNQMQASLMLLNEFYADHSKKIQSENPLNNIKNLKEDLGADIDILQDTYEKTQHKATKDIRLLYKFYLDQTLHHSKMKPKIKHTVPENQNPVPTPEPEHQNKKTLPLHIKNMNLTKTIKSHSGMKSALFGQESNSHSISHQMRQMGPHHSDINLKEKSAAAKKLVTRLDFQKVFHNEQSKNDKENQMPNTQAANPGNHNTFQKDEPYLTTKRKSHHHKSLLPRRKSADYLIPQSFTQHLKSNLNLNTGGDQSSRETLTTAQTNSSNMFNLSIHNDHKNINLKKRLMSFGAHDFKQILEKHETYPKKASMAVTCLSARTTDKEIKAMKPPREEGGENKQKIFTKIFEKNMLINNLKQDIKNSLQNFSDAYKKAKHSKFDPKPLQKIDEEPKQNDQIENKLTLFGTNLDQAAVLEKDSQDETEMIAQAEDIMTEILMNIEADNSSNKELVNQAPVAEKGLLSKLEDEHVLNKNDIEILKNLKEMDKLINYGNQLPIEGGTNPTATFQALQKKVEKDGKFKNTKYFVPAIPQRKVQIKEVANQNKEEEEKHKKELEAYFTNRELISDFENMLEKSNSLVIQGNKINEQHIDEDEFLQDLIKNKQEHYVDGENNLSFNLDGDL